MRYLVVNADDFGYSFGVNRGIIEAHTNGIVTSTSVMVDAIGAEEAAELVAYPDLSVGLHFVALGIKDLEGALKRQLERFEHIVGRIPDHLDTHKQHTDATPELKRVLQAYTEKHKRPVRRFGHAKFIEDFFGLGIDGSGPLKAENVSVGALKGAIDKATDEFNEIMCHAGYSDDYLQEHSSYNDIREIELETLMRSEIRDYIAAQEDLQLCNWNFVASMVFA